MIHIEAHILVHRPIEEVFLFVSAAQHLPQWQTSVLEARHTPEGPIGVGTKFTLVRAFLGRKLEQHAEVVECEPPTWYAYKSTSGPPTTGANRFEPTGEGTTVTIAFETEMGSVFALAEPLVARSMRRVVEASLGNLKDLLES
jgi:uncharacterized protein YndB with AHSA1/START domain